MNTNIQDNQTKQNLSKKLKNIFTLFLHAAPKVSLVPAAASGKNHQASPDLFDDSAIHQSIISGTSLFGVFPCILSAILALFLFSGNLFAATAKLAWDASSSSGVTGYKVSYGTSSGSYTSTIDVGNTTTYALSGLTEGTQYYFAVKAYDSAKTTESAYSNEVNLTVPVTATALTATFTPASPISVEQGKSVTFTDTTTGTVTSRTWNLPNSNATTSIAQVVTVSYPTAGTYNVTLTVTGSSGSANTTKQITVTAPSTTTPPPTTTTTTTTSYNGLVAAYGFEEISGKTVADASGNANHGTIKEAVRITTGKYGRALKFDGVNDWVTVKDSASLALSTGMTLEAWVYPTVSMSNWRTIVMKEQASSHVYSLYANTDTNQQALYSWLDAETSVSGGDQLSPNKWWHVVGTYDGQNEMLYINGIKVAEQPQSGNILTSTGALRIGGNSSWGEYFQGYIDEVRIYNRALTATEINYNLKTAISVSNPQKFVLGDKNLEPWVDYRAQGIAEAFQAIPAQSGIVTSVQVYLDASSTATNLVAGIYKNNNGHPGARIAQGTLSTLKPGAWNSVAIPVAAVTAGQPYWIAILGAKGQIVFRDQVGSGTGLMETSASKILTSLPATWTGSVTKTNAAMSLFGKGY